MLKSIGLLIIIYIFAYPFKVERISKFNLILKLTYRSFLSDFLIIKYKKREF